MSDMSAIAQELDHRLQSLDPATVARVERLVRDALALAEARGGADGWPPGYFERTAGSFAGEPLERPPQGTAEQRENW